MVYYCTYKGHTTWLSRQFHELRPMYPAKRWTSKSKYLTVWDLAWLQNRITWNSTTSLLLSLQPGDYITLQGFFQTHTHCTMECIITHCIVVTNRHTHQVPWSTCQVKHSQEQTVNTRLESKSHGISIWHKGSQVNTKILHHTQTKALTILWYPARDPASFPLTAQNYSSPLLASQHYTRALSSSLSLSFSPRATAYVSLSANTPPCQTVYHNLSRLSVILSMPVGTFTTPRGLSRSPTAISKTGATLIESFSLSDFTRSWVS